MSKRKNKSKNKNPKQQAIDRLKAMCQFGRSKHLDKLHNGGKPLRDVIYSINALRNNIACCIRFVVAAEAAVGRLPDIDGYRPYVKTYLLQRIEEGKSADTIHDEASALAKLYGCGLRDFGVKLPQRRRGNNVKNRSHSWRKHYNPANHPELELVCHAFGVRRCEVLRIVPQQVKRRADGSVYLLAVWGKGGKIRDIDAYPPLEDEVWALAQRAIAEGWKLLVPYKPQSHAPIHQYRAIYAWAMYWRYARPIEDVPYRERYNCRRDMVGLAYDKDAMWIVAENLGHERLNVVTNYFAVAIELKDPNSIKGL